MSKKKKNIKMILKIYKKFIKKKLNMKNKEIQN